MGWTIAFDRVAESELEAFRDVRPTLARLRAAFGLRTLAALLDTDPGNLSRSLAGKRRLPPEIARRAIDLDHVLTRAAQIFQPPVVLDWLLGGDPFLNGARPVDVLATHGAGPLLEALDGAAAGAYA
ncbi:MAG: hypothetical protein ABI346_03785 [Candidatus Baltobacteraceae bacterium]